jgi:hypothetical protein
VLEGRGGAAVAGLDPLQVAADLPGAQRDAPLGEGLAELPAGPGPFFGEQSRQFVGHAVAMGEVGGGAGSERLERVEAAGEEGAEQVADGLAAIAEVPGDAGGRPACVGEEDHLDAVADLRCDRRAPQGLESITSCVVELCADHTEL